MNHFPKKKQICPILLAREKLRNSTLMYIEKLIDFQVLKCKTIPLFHYSGGVSHQLSATRLLSSPEGSRHPLDGLDQTWPWNDSYSSLHRDTYTEVRVPRRPVFTWGCFRACRAKIHQSLAKRKVSKQKQKIVM